MADNFSVLISVVGHASRQWLGARNAQEADRFNMALSVQRAQGVRAVVERIVKARIPDLPIEIIHNGVGSREPAPTVSEPNAAVDRSVLVTVDLATTTTENTYVSGPDRRVYTPSNSWLLRVLNLVPVTLLGAQGTLATIEIRNRQTGKSIKMRGSLAGRTWMGPRFLRKNT
jgi:hypothetical protein